MKDARKMRYPAKDTADKHDRIVKEASRLFRERGFENVTVSEVMKAAGLTHGAFYAHFGSKAELQKAAVVYGQGVSAGRARSHGPTKKATPAYADWYLSSWHRNHPGNGCTMAALAQEVARSEPEIQTAFESGFEEILSARGGDRNEMIFQTAALLGAIVLARAMHDPRISDEILESVRERIRWQQRIHAQEMHCNPH
jgi:TetR/AcrR family transcriptional repressor of nem operon